MDPNPIDSPPQSLRERLWKRWFPPVAVLGGIATLVVASTRKRPEPTRGTDAAPATGGRTTLAVAEVPVAPAPAPGSLALDYRPVGTIGGAPAFQRSLLDVTVGADDRVYALGDGEVRVFDAKGAALAQWPVTEPADCLTVAADGRVFVAGGGRVEIFDARGTRIGGFVVADGTAPANITALRVVGTEVLAADAGSRIIWRLDAAGRVLNRIGDQNKTKAFILPNGRLDLGVDASGTVLATDTGRHRVTSWALDGTPVGAFGKFGMADPADFVGCCNPVNLALTPDGKVVTGEKMVPRVKVFERDGRLIGYIGPEHFDRMVTQIHLAVDARGRVLAGDPVRRTITVFAPSAGKGRGDV
jgi:hypothetical protein